MKLTPSNAHCPIASTLKSLGAWWSLLILRDAFRGVRRFDQLQKSLGIAPNILSQRLAQLTEAGLLERRPYCQHPPRYEYILTPKGRDFFPVVTAVFTWGNKHLFPNGPALLFADAHTRRAIDPVMIDRASGHEIRSTDVVLVTAPRARRGKRAAPQSEVD